MTEELKKWIDDIGKYCPEIIDKLKEFFTKLAEGESCLGENLSAHERMLIESQLSVPRAFSSRLKIDPNELVGFLTLFAENANTIAAICRFTDNNDSFVKFTGLLQENQSDGLPVAIVEAQEKPTGKSGQSSHGTLIGMNPVQAVKIGGQTEVLKFVPPEPVDSQEQSPRPKPPGSYNPALVEVEYEPEPSFAEATDGRPEPEPEPEPDMTYDPHSWEWLETFNAKEWINSFAPRIQMALMMYYAGFESAYTLERLPQIINKGSTPFGDIRSTRMITVLMKERKFTGIHADQALFTQVGERKGTKHTPHILTERGIEVCRELIMKKVDELLGE